MRHTECLWLLSPVSALHSALTRLREGHAVGSDITRHRCNYLRFSFRAGAMPSGYWSPAATTCALHRSPHSSSWRLPQSGQRHVRQNKKVPRGFHVGSLDVKLEEEKSLGQSWVSFRWAADRAQHVGGGGGHVPWRRRVRRDAVDRSTATDSGCVYEASRGPGPCMHALCTFVLPQRCCATAFVPPGCAHVEECRPSSRDEPGGSSRDPSD